VYIPSKHAQYIVHIQIVHHTHGCVCTKNITYGNQSVSRQIRQSSMSTLSSNETQARLSDDESSLASLH